MKLVISALVLSFISIAFFMYASSQLEHKIYALYALSSSLSLMGFAALYGSLLCFFKNKKSYAKEGLSVHLNKFGENRTEAGLSAYIQNQITAIGYSLFGVTLIGYSVYLILTSSNYPKFTTGF